MQIPETLSEESRRMWEKLASEYNITDSGGLYYLRIFCEARDRVAECQEVIRREGMQVLDRFQRPKAHPLLSVERDARSQQMLALKGLALEVCPDQKTKPGKVKSPGWAR
ncbi:MAG: hypothetical protein EG824_06895 [Deltaproteobacteria bacterium]|nr:hypothetical protein [Deltaproteobacteria bacterium]